MSLIDQDQRDAVMASTSHIAIAASAGSGKTTIMTKKMAEVIESIENHQTIAAITFTIKAHKEIENKALKQMNSNEIFVTKTNDAFVEHEIIRPFIVDALGEEFTREYTVDYSNDYKFTSYQEGLDQLKQEMIVGTYENHLKRNFNFQLALQILKTSIAAQEYLKTKYYMIFIDEYQDSDQDMHEFFMWIKNQLQIRMFVVGDAKQAIYLWRGAMKNVFNLLSDEGFENYQLIKNFRCDKEIENYANLIHNPDYYISFENPATKMVIQDYPFTRFEEFPNYFMHLINSREIDENKEITIISNFNNEARNIAELLTAVGYDFIFIPKTPIDEGIPNSNLLRELAMYMKNGNRTVFDFIANTQIDERVQTRETIRSIIEVLKSNGVNAELCSKVIHELSGYLEIDISTEEIDRFERSVLSEEFELAFKELDSKFKVMTVFASKGLEFDQVISFTKYYQLHRGEHFENHYVCITRAKEKFIMFNNNSYYYRYLINEIDNVALDDYSYIFKHLLEM